MSIEKFIKNSRLRWSHNKGCPDHELADHGEVQAVELGAHAMQPYSHEPNKPPCVGTHYGPGYQASAFTRPRDESSDRLGLEKNEGFFLDLNNKKRSGTVSTSAGEYTGANIYYEYDREAGWIRYYIMYGWSHAPQQIDTAIRYVWPSLSVLPAPRYICCHEGEWEGLSIKLDPAGSPTHVFYNTHHDGILVGWDEVPKTDGTHPQAFSALGAHASYPTADTWPTQFGDDVTGSGLRWTTWESPTSLVEVTDQDWYGFGGAWGGIQLLNKWFALPKLKKELEDELPFPLGFLDVGSNFVGPLGPSMYMHKTPFECGLDPQCFPDTYRTWP